MKYLSLSLAKIALPVVSPIALVRKSKQHYTKPVDSFGLISILVKIIMIVTWKE